MINNTGTSFVIRFHMACLVYPSLIQFHLSEWHTSSAHQLIADKSVLIGRETMYQQSGISPKVVSLFFCY